MSVPATDSCCERDWKAELEDLCGLVLSVLVSRAGSYGSPVEAMQRHAALFGQVLGHDVSPGQAALVLASLKLSRLSYDPDHIDSWIDLAGYALIGALVCNKGLHEGDQR